MYVVSCYNTETVMILLIILFTLTSTDYETLAGKSQTSTAEPKEAELETGSAPGAPWRKENGSIALLEHTGGQRVLLGVQGGRNGGREGGRTSETHGNAGFLMAPK